MKEVKVGDTISYEREAVVATAVVATIDWCPRRGDKYGDDVQSMPWDQREYGYFGLRGGGFVYGRELR